MELNQRNHSEGACLRASIFFFLSFFLCLCILYIRVCVCNAAFSRVRESFTSFVYGVLPSLSAARALSLSVQSMRLVFCVLSDQGFTVPI